MTDRSAPELLRQTLLSLLEDAQESLTTAELRERHIRWTLAW